MSEITKDQVKRVAELAHLDYASDELEQFLGQFKEILDYFEQLQEVETAGVEPLFHASNPAETPWRDDAVLPSLPRETVLSQAPVHDDEHFRVPKVIE